MNCDYPEDVSCYDVGVYEIVNLQSNKAYIGSTKQNFTRRLAAHRYRLRRGVHSNEHLQRSFDKYGEDAFEINILESVDEVGLVREREKYWIKKRNEKYDQIYNQDIVDGKSWERSEETIEKIIESSRQRWEDEEYRSLMEEVVSSFDQEFYDKRGECISKAKSKQHQGTKLVDPNGNVVILTGGVKQFAENHGIDPEGLSRLLVGKNFNVGGWTLFENNREKIPDKRNPRMDSKLTIMNIETGQIHSRASLSNLETLTGIPIHRLSKLKAGSCKTTGDTWIKIPDKENIEYQDNEKVVNA